MFGFYLRRALRSLRRTPVLSTVMIVDVALGLGVWTLAFTAVDAQTRFPPGRARNVYHVDWGTTPEFDPASLDGFVRVLSITPHMLLPYGDAQRLGAHRSVARHAATFTSQLAVSAPTGRHCLPVRFSEHALFGMFELE